MRQYLGIKAQYPDAILFFRMGDFYEMFFEDALLVGPVLDIAVTSRDKNREDPVPMAGIPYHAIGGYLRTLVERGYKVAICEQTETPEEAKKRKGPKIVNREVVRVVSPGALLDEEHLDAHRANFMCAVVPSDELPGPAGVAALDISSGEFSICWAEDADALKTELARLSPAELVVDPKHHAWLRGALDPNCPRLEGSVSEAGQALRQRVRHLAEESGTQGREELRVHEVEAAARCLAYAEATQPGQTLLLHRLRRHSPDGHLRLDETSIRNLEIFHTLRDGNRKGSLLWAIDRTCTAMGGRTLRSWLAAPLCRADAIAQRQDGIEALLHEAKLRAELQSRLKDVRDVVRLAARARLGTIKPRELAAMRRSLDALPTLAERLEELRGRRTDRELPAALELGEDLLRDLWEDLEANLVDDPPAITREGGIIRSEADAELGEQRALRDNARDLLAALETREREATGIAKLRIQHNRVFGYFYEVSKSFLSQVPDHYVRKQTLANAERFVTEELAQLETRILGAQQAALVRELALYEELRARVSEAAERLVVVGERLARLDVLAGLAEVAESEGFCRPEILDKPILEIEDGRHPVVERMLERGRFVPNDATLAAMGGVENPRLWLITGPNMGGKSTVMRQVALVTILAHIGSYVPARAARVGLCDRVFTRVGAADDLGRGESTFMVEMRETAQILSQASKRSLVLLDEVGRGTATYDGLALAWSITEHLHDQIGCRTMFATHYHELCGLADRLAGVRNVHVAVDEHRGRIVFLHKIEQGPAGRSYGVQVGRLAGLPGRVLRRAKRILARLEASEHAEPTPQLDLFAPKQAEGEYEDAAAVQARLDDVGDLLRGADPDDLSPRAAHALLCKLKDLVED
jgi:DNA mismatch repair protein MutS